LDWLDESNTDEKSLKEAITIKLQNQMTLLVSGSMSMETRISPDDPKDFYSSLKKKPPSPVADPIKIELSRFFEEKNTENLQVLNAYPIIKKLFLKYNTALPTSAAVERIFSLGGRILSPLRTKLGDFNFESLMFLRSNRRSSQENSLFEMYFIGKYNFLSAYTLNFK
jgi:hypothetical protein